jgi:superfamily II DNA or RNA helicase
MPTAKLVIHDEVNVQFKGLDPETLSACQEELTFFVPGYVHMANVKLGWWDGRIRLLHQSGFTHFNLVEYLDSILIHGGYDIEIEDRRTWTDTISEQLGYIDDTYLRAFNDRDGNPITLWKHQVTGVNTAIQRGQGILELATGSGKTIICGIMAKIWSVHGNVVVIVPNIDLVIQTQHEFQKRVGIDCGIWYGERKERKAITIATWQSLDHFPELFNDVICVIVDEVHQAKAKVLSEMLSGPAKHVPFRFGCTGTLPKEDLFRKQIEGTIGKHIYIVRSKYLQDLGVLAEATIYQMKLGDSQNIKWTRSAPYHELWKDELDWMFGDPERLAYKAITVEEIAEEFGNTLVLVQYRDHGKKLAALLPDAVSLDGRNKDRTDHYEAFNAGDNNILICTYGIASTGIDIPRIFNLILIEPGKKFEKVMQTLGRGFRKAIDKSHINVFDICGDSGLSKKHAARRRTLYREAQQTLHTIDVEYTDADSNG